MAIDKVDRPVSTSIYFLLPSGNVSRLHRIPCAETWHHYIGDPITVSIPLSLSIYVSITFFILLLIIEYCFNLQADSGAE